MANQSIPLTTLTPTHTHTHAPTPTPHHIHTHTLPNARTHTHTHTHAHTHLHHTHTHTHAPTPTHTHTHTHTHTYCQFEKLWCMIASSFSIHHLSQQELLKHGTMSKHAHMLQLWVKTRHSTSLGDCYFVKWLAMSALNQLNNNIAVDEIRANPRWVENSATRIQEHETNDVVSNMTLFVDLYEHTRVNS